MMVFPGCQVTTVTCSAPCGGATVITTTEAQLPGPDPRALARPGVTHVAFVPLTVSTGSDKMGPSGATQRIYFPNGQVFQARRIGTTLETLWPRRVTVGSDLRR
jgi:hypothetical protein